MRHVKTDWALIVAADMPFFEFEALRPLAPSSSPEAVIPLVGGKPQPLAAFYRRELANFFSHELNCGRRKILSAIKTVAHALAALPGEDFFFNVNTRADLRLARGRAENLSPPTPTISIVAPESGTGKTTFIERLIKIFAAQGIQVGVIKSDAHSFQLDTAGKDSFRFQTAWAPSVAVVSPKSWFIIQRVDGRADFANMARQMAGVDLILTESRTHGTCPAISLWRGRGSVIADETVAAIFTSEPAFDDAIAQFDLNDIPGTALQIPCGLKT